MNDKFKDTNILLCVSNHPSDLSFYYHLNKVRLALGLANVKPVLLRIQHPYDARFSMSFYLENSNYEHVFNLNDVPYNKDIFRGLKELKIFNDALRNVVSDLESAKSVVALVPQSAYFPVSRLLSQLPNLANLKALYRQGVQHPQYYKTDKLRTLLSRVYSSVGQSFPVRSIILGGNIRGQDFDYTVPIPGQPYVVSAELNAQRNEFPAFYARNRVTEKGQKPIVVFFGDATYYDFHGRNLKGMSQDQYDSLLVDFFDRFKQVYKSCELFYKPHPFDGNRLMPGVTKDNFRILDGDEGTSEVVLDKYLSRILSTYTISSSSGMSSLLRGIPTYMLYRLFMEKNSQFIVSFSSYESEKVNPRLCLLENIQEISKIDSEIGRHVSINIEPWKSLLLGEYKGNG